MYKIKVPVQCRTLELYDKNQYVKQLKSMGAEEVFLCPSGDITLWENYDDELTSIKKNVDFLHENGFKAGVWVWTFAFEKESEYVYMTNPKGKRSRSMVCPSDLQYRKRMGGFIQDCAKCGIDMFMFDDDFRYGFTDIDFGCCCKNHLKLTGEILGREVTLEDMDRHLLYGEENEYRSAFLKANGQMLEDFAQEMRRYLDEVNPDVRMGFCSCITSWDIDGTHPDKIAKLLAGNTKPFYRLIGAPYWANERNWGNRLADVIELERIEASGRQDNDIEIFSEGDTYPRPRFKVPYVYLEILDTALRVADCTDGILKYVFDYYSSANYEKEYVNAHNRNESVYKSIDEIFKNKKSVGVRIWNNPQRFKSVTIPEKYEGKMNIEDIAFSASSRMISELSFPSIHEGENTLGVAFGEDILAVPEEHLSDGLIIDIDACRRLQKIGIDTGIISFGGKLNAFEEIYKFSGEHVGVYGAEFTAVTLKENVQIESEFLCKNKLYPASYRYENADGQRFLVYCFNGYFNNESVYRQYARASQIKSAAKWLSGKEIPVVCQGNPDLYIQAKKDENKTAVALWNIFPDRIENPIVELDFLPTKIKALNCTAEIKENKVFLSPINAYDFCAFEVE